jgi:hypothetical protein
MAAKRLAARSRKAPRPARKARPSGGRRGTPVSNELPTRCRCQCSAVCLITGPASIPRNVSKTYGLTVNIARNSGCKQGTSDCKNTETTWTKGGTLGGRVTLSDQEPNSVKVIVGGTNAGSFTLTATPKVKCECIGTNAEVECQAQSNTATITVT